MKVRCIDSNIVIEDMEDFDIGQTLECGQCFHFKKVEDNYYAISAMNRLLRVRQQGTTVILYDVTIEEFNNVWYDYFDLGRDYGALKKHLLKEDAKLKEAIETMWGVRILKQEFFETLISFIISQNKQIPHIKHIVAEISKKYGEYLGEVSGEEFYSFPTVEQMVNVTEDELRQCKVGFRAPYIRDAVSMVASGKLKSEELIKSELSLCREMLMRIKGVGSKVANCVMLFGLGRYEAFPVDVWIKRIVEALYFNGAEVDKARIEEFGLSRFGQYSGFAQQYMFYYGKSMNLGVKNKKSIMKV